MLERKPFSSPADASPQRSSLGIPACGAGNGKPQSPHVGAEDFGVRLLAARGSGQLSGLLSPHFQGGISSTVVLVASLVAR